VIVAGSLTDASRCFPLLGFYFLSAENFIAVVQINSLLPFFADHETPMLDLAIQVGLQMRSSNVDIPGTLRVS